MPSAQPRYALIAPHIVDWMRKEGVNIPFYDFAEQ
jgi:hypothetical protein